MKLSAKLLLALAVAAPLVQSWAPRSAHRTMAARRPVVARRSSSLRMNINANEPADGTAIKMTTLDRESIIYDSRTGRFYEKEIEAICRDEYCALDERTGKPIVLSVVEKERVFVEAMQAYFYDGREVLNDKDFDQLKEDLLWEGSQVAALNRDETKYLAAMQAYLTGEPIMKDNEFDELKQKLKAANSAIAVSKEPKCFIDTGVCSVTWTKDSVRQAISYTPAIAVVTIAWLIVAFELPILKSLNPIFSLILGSPLIYFGSIIGAENIFYKDPLVVSGPCPDCNSENRIFFGSVLGIEGYQDEAKLKCSNCKVELTVARDTLRVSSPAKFGLPEDVKKEPAAAVAAE